MKTKRRRARVAWLVLVMVFPLFSLGCETPGFIFNPGPAQTVIRTQYDAWRGGLLNWLGFGADIAGDLGVDLAR